MLSKDKSAVVGKISKQWSGFARELFTDSDYFGISFPLDLDVRMKAVMIGACFLIVSFEPKLLRLRASGDELIYDLVIFFFSQQDFMFFEKSGNQESDGLGMC